METIITIKNNKPAYQALILLARELEKNDKDSIIVVERGNSESINFIAPTRKPADIADDYALLKDFPSLEEIRKKAWPNSM